MAVSSDERSPDPVDIHVGDRIRRRRRAMGLSQEGLADQLDLTFQQVQKYERGANRVSASKLYHIARALRSPLLYFFEGLADPSLSAGVAENEAVFKHDAPPTPEERELMSGLSRIRSRRVRRRILELVRSLGEDVGSDDPAG